MAHNPHNDQNSQNQRLPAAIWILEDNAFYRQNLEKLIAGVPWVSHLKTFETGERLLESLKEDSPPDLLLLDLGLPGIDGITILKKIKIFSPETRVLILTVQDHEEKIFQAISNGADGYLLKASTPESLVQSIRDVLNGGSPINAFIANKILTSFKQTRSAAPDYGLTDREKEILELLVQGTQRKMIAEKIFISYHTVDFHIRNIYSKLRVNTLPDAVAKSIRENIV